MIFKIDWEKTDKTHILPKKIIERMLDIAFPNKNLNSYEIILAIKNEKSRQR